MHFNSSPQSFEGECAVVPLIGKKILLVEDDIILAMAFQDMLEDLGMFVAGPCLDVSSALELIEVDDKIDAALLDIDLDGEPSFTIAQALKLRDIPFTFATGYGSVGLADAPPAPVIGKPFTEQQLLDCLKSLFVSQDAA